MKRKLALLLVGALLAGAIGAVAMDQALDRDAADLTLFQFVRIQYNSYLVSGWGWGRNGPPWAHDYPRAENNFLKILSELTTVETTEQSYRVLRLHDEEILNYPFLYVSEPGYWDITDREAENLRTYLDRGGFILFDDFRGIEEWRNLVRCMQQVYPDRVFRQLVLDDPIFQCFFNIDSLNLPAPYELPGMGEPTFYGMSDDEGRLFAVACLNTDIGDYWEWSDEAFTPIEYSNEAYKFGVNFVVYALTH